MIMRRFNLTTVITFSLIASLFMNYPAYAGNGREANLPPFSVAGTVINPPEKSVLIEPLAHWNSQLESATAKHSLWFKEGDSVQGYRIVKIFKDRVTFARSGKTYRMTVGYGHFSPVVSGKNTDVIIVNERGTVLPPLRRIEPAVPFDHDKAVKAEFIPPPENIAAIRMEAQAFLGQLSKSPAFIQKTEEIRAKLYKRLKKGNTPILQESLKPGEQT